MASPFRLTTSFEPKGDQPQAIEQLASGLERGDRDQVLLGITGSGKTFTIANAIEHGHRHSPEGIITLRATALVDQVRLTIVDTGSWKPPQAAADRYRGRGITLMRALMQDVAIHPDATGTTVHLFARIT